MTSDSPTGFFTAGTCRGAAGPAPCTSTSASGGALKRFGPDGTITGGYHHWVAISALRYARRRCDLILWSESTLRDLRPGSRLLERYKRSYVGRIDRFLVPGTAAREFLVSLGASPDRIWIAPNAVDREAFESTCKDTTGPFTMLYVGRLIPYKRVGDSSSAFAPLDAGGARLLIVGEGAQEAELRRVADRRGLRQVGFAGFRQPSSLPSVTRRPRSWSCRARATRGGSP